MKRETLLAGALAGGGVWLVARVLDWRARWDLCLVVAVAVGLCWALVRSVPALRDPDPYEDVADPPDDGLLVLASLESRLSWGATDPDRFRDRVRPLLVELATDRLVSRRGVDLRTQPELARQILGDPLWTMLTVPPARSPGRAELSDLVTAIERI